MPQFWSDKIKWTYSRIVKKSSVLNDKKHNMIQFSTKIWHVLQPGYPQIQIGQLKDLYSFFNNINQYVKFKIFSVYKYKHSPEPLRLKRYMWSHHPFWMHMIKIESYQIQDTGSRSFDVWVCTCPTNLSNLKNILNFGRNITLF